MERFHADGRLTAEARLLIGDQRAALEMVMDLVGGRRELSSSYIRELHRGLTEHQDTRDAIDAQGRRFAAPLLKGEWKRLPNNPIRPDGRIHEYCPPEFVQDEIDRLIAWHARHDAEGVCPEVEAAWLHHRFAQMHPFEDGNGRVARALTAAVFLRSEYLVLVIRDEEHRDPYLDSLEAADDGATQAFGRSLRRHPGGRPRGRTHTRPLVAPRGRNSLVASRNERRGTLDKCDSYLNMWLRVVLHGAGRSRASCDGTRRLGPGQSVRLVRGRRAGRTIVPDVLADEVRIDDAQ